MPKSWFNFKKTSANMTTAKVPTAKVPTAKVPTAKVPTANMPTAKVPTANMPTAKSTTKKKISLRKKISNLFTRKNKTQKKLSAIQEEKYKSEEFFDALEILPSDNEEFQKRLSELKKRSSSRIITKFMRNTTAKRKANFLGKKCPDSGVCMALGIYTNDIKKFFGGFTDFSNCEDSIKRIGSDSANGFINEIKYVNSSYKDITTSKSTALTVAPASLAPASLALASANKKIQYTAYAILKSSGRIDSDNLMYEYSVGQYINKKNKFFPCFLETYELYKYKTIDDWEIMRSTSVKKKADLIQGLITQPIDYNVACAESVYIAILIQHFKGVKSLKDMIGDKNFIESYDLTCILFQIYYTLSALENTFTHYDLHWNNVLLYEPEKDKYIEYHYHYYNNIISFKSKYMVKIIDYGRSFFYNSSTDNSAKIYNDVCYHNPECNIPKYSCGKSRGFYWLNKQNKQKNVSADLRLLEIIYRAFKRISFINFSQYDLKEMLQKLNYDENPETGNPFEDKKTGFPNKINNVTDAFLEIKNIIFKNYKNISIKNQEQFENKQKLGDLHIYYDRKPMEFTPYNPSIKEIDTFISELELQILSLKSSIFRLAKEIDVDRDENMIIAYEKIVLLENKKTNLFFSKIDKMDDLAALEMISKDLESSIITPLNVMSARNISRAKKTSAMASAKKTSAMASAIDITLKYDLDFLLLNNNNFKQKMEYVNARINYLIRKKTYTKRNETDV